MSLSLRARRRRAKQSKDLGSPRPGFCRLRRLPNGWDCRPRDDTRFDCVVFDIDNVLVDTRASYTDAIRKTVQIYLQSRLKFKPAKKPLLTRRDVETFKSLGGFNDDWDACYGLLLYFAGFKTKNRSVNELRKLKNLKVLERRAGAKPLGTKGIEKICGKKKEISLRKIAAIFQRLYLGRFARYEKLIIPKSFLSHLRRTGLKLGIVTGRNRDEARMALGRFKIEKLFHAVITADDTPKKFKKPHPYGLLKLSQKLGKNLRYCYVGDLVDDILAAGRAKSKINIRSLGFLKATVSPKEMARDFKKAGADFICTRLDQLKNYIVGHI